MDNRGQAALEYLMTYGWALIIIATVVGVLVFIVSSPAGNIVCNSSDPAKIIVKAAQVPSSQAKTLLVTTDNNQGTIQLQNLTGGNITINSCTNGGGFKLGETMSQLGCSQATVVSGEVMTLRPDPSITAGTYQTSTVAIAYTDYATLARTATITCSGPIKIS